MTLSRKIAPQRFGAIIAAPCCRIGVKTEDDRIREIAFLPPDTPIEVPTNELAQQAADQITAWLNDATYRFDLPLETLGTPFQQKVWRAIAAIPRGTVSTYGELAAQLASNARAVGQACGANPFPLVIPCHRVVSRQGLGGFAHAADGWLIATKRWLLTHEGAI